MSGLYTTVPNGFLLCNGQEVAIASFHKLYTEIGYLSCCQSSNTGMFKIPDLRNRFLEGANGNLGIYIEAGIPNIIGSLRYFSDNAVWSGEASGAFEHYYNISSKQIPNVSTSGTSNAYYFNFNASLSNSIYGNSNTVQPPAVCINYIIKY